MVQSLLTDVWWTGPAAAASVSWGDDALTILGRRRSRAHVESRFAHEGIRKVDEQ